MFASLICHCMHDQLSKGFERKQWHPKKPVRRALGAQRERIRLDIDYTYLNNTADSFHCFDNTSQIWWGGYPYRCTNEDILTLQNIKVIKETLDNVKKYIESIFYVDPTPEPFELWYSPRYFPQLPQKIAKDCDLILTVVTRPYEGGSVLASALSLQTDFNSFRPIEGAIFINAHNLPKEPQSEFTEDSSFFYTCVHEVFHAMGLSGNDYINYHPRNSNNPYSETTCEITKDGKVHTFLVTPHAHAFAVHQWGEETFSNGTKECKSGIELEDGGGGGTMKSHPEGRIAQTDLMTGINVQGSKGTFNRFTPLSMAILLDTGNYDIDFTKIKPLLWGSKEIFGGKFNGSFVMDSPYYSFPQQYIHKDKEDLPNDKCGFDFKFIGNPSYFNLEKDKRWVCDPEPTSAKIISYCNGRKFYNPANKKIIGYEEINDFQTFRYPREICKKGYACIGGVNSCSKFNIAKDKKSFTIFAYDEYGQKNVNVTCNKETSGKKITIDSYTVHCPPVEQFIKTVTMYEDEYLKEDIFDDNPRPPLPPNPTPNPTPKTPNPTPKTPNPTPKTPNPTPKTPNPTPKTPNPTPKTPNPTPKTPNPTPKTPKPTPKTPNPTPKTPKPTPKTPNPTPKTPNPTPKTPNPTEVPPPPKPEESNTQSNVETPESGESANSDQSNASSASSSKSATAAIVSVVVIIVIIVSAAAFIIYMRKRETTTDDIQNMDLLV